LKQSDGTELFYKKYAHSDKIVKSANELQINYFQALCNLLRVNIMSKSQYTLLIVDDFVADRELYCHWLLADSRDCYVPIAAESVAEGLERCCHHKIDAILLDYRLPDADGLEFLAALVDRYQGNPPPVVMLTGQGNENIAVQAMKLGAQDYLVKRDLTPAILQLALRNAIENARLKRQLAQSEERFRVSIDNMGECVAIFSAIRDDLGQIRDFRYDYLNSAALENNRMTAKDIGRPLCDVFPAVRTSGLLAEYCQLIATGQPLIKEELVYEDVFGGERLTRAYSIHATKLDDGFVSCWRDLTAQRTTERELQAADRKLIEIWESMTDAYITVDRDWRIIYANQAATQIICHLTNLAPTEFLGRSHWDLFPSLVDTDVEREFRRALTDRVTLHLEVWFEPTGSWFESHLYPAAEGLGIYFRDISDRKRDEELLRQSEELKRRILESNRDCIKVVDLQGRLVYMNDYGQSLMEIDNFPTVAGGQWLEFWENSDRAAAQTAFSIGLAGGVGRFDGYCATAKGTPKWWEVIVTPILAADGRVSQVLSVSRDISLRKQLEAERLAAEQERDRFFNQSLDLLAIGNFDGYFERINPAFERLLGFTEAEFLARPFVEFVHPDDREFTLAGAQSLAQGEIVVDFENRCQCKDGSYVWVSWNATPYQQSNCWYGVGRDISDRKRLEAERLAAEQERDRFFDLSIDLLATINFDGYFTRLNPAWETTLGFSNAELIDSPFIEFVYPDDRAASLATAQGISEGEVVVSFENRYLCKDGSYRWLLWSAIPYPEQNVMYAIAHDITERKQMEMARIEAEQDRDRFFNLSIDLLAIGSFDGYLQRLNPAWEETLGFSRIELMAEPFVNFVHPDDRELTLAAAQSLIDGTPMISCENRYRCKDGSYRWVEWNAIPYAPKQVWYAIGHDVTERKQAEAALQASERKFTAIFEQSFELMGIVSLDGVLLEVNQTALDSIEARREDIAGKLFWETPWWHTEQLQQQLQDSIARAASGEFMRYEVQFPHPSGVLLTTDFSLKPVFDDAGKVWTIVAEAHDITDRKCAERDLHESQERLRTGIEVAGVGLARFDYPTNLVVLSPEAAALYGFAPHELVVTREQIHATFHPDERAALEETIAQVVDPAGTGWFAQDHRVVWPSGEVRCLSVRKQVFFDRSGVVARPIYAILAAVDITERKQTQADLEARNQELDSFVYIVSHDLKAPLRAVSNLSRWIEEDFDGSLSAANQQQMTLLRTRIDRMSATIDGLLDYARIGRIEGSIEPVAIAEVIAETIDSLSPPSTFQIAIAQNLPTLHTKRILIAQIFANLIGNAIKHHDRVDGMIHVGIAERKEFYEFAIADDGPGIAPEQHDRVFKIFHAVNPQKRSDSTGIGLAIVQKIIEAEGGTIRLESQLGEGTTFYFTWPKRVERG
jgi:PAS domain S-box-containing protein